MSLYDPEAFEARVNLAASYMLAGRQTTRTFDGCFEMFDGLVVIEDLRRRAERNPELMRAWPRYLCVASMGEAKDKFGGVPRRQLKEEARKARERGVRN